MHDDPIAARLAEVTVGAVEPGAVVLVAPDPTWATRGAELVAQVRAVLGPHAGRVEHVGSTSVPGLVAKPVLDLVAEVPDPADEPRWLPQLVEAGWELRIREPDWFEHRMLRPPDRSAHLHVFPHGCEEVDRMVRFRDLLRRDPRARERYAAVKRELAARAWPTVQHYADAKSAVVAELLGTS